MSCSLYDIAWAKLLKDDGFVTLIVDSFRPRNTFSVCKEFVRSASPPERALDAYGALSYLASLPYVDAQRVGVIGWSHGGVAVLHAVSRLGLSAKFYRRFSAAITFYPYCLSDRSFDLPVLILIGESDDWTPPGLCEELYRRSKGPGVEDTVELIVYPDAHHAFDEKELKTGYAIEDGYGNMHLLKYNAEAYKDSVEQVRRFLDENL